MNETIKRILLHILTARRDNAKTSIEYQIWESCLTIVNYALNENYDCLRQFDYLETIEDYVKEQNNENIH